MPTAPAPEPSNWPRTSPPRCSPSPGTTATSSATAHGKNVAPRVAAKLDVAQLSDITKVVSPTPERPIYAGNAIATVQSADAIKVITVRTTGFDAAAVAAPPSKPPAAADSGKEQLRRQRTRQERPPRADRRQDHRLRGRALGSSEVQRGAHAAGRQARRGAGPAAPRWTQALCAQRLAGRQTGKIVAPSLWRQPAASAGDPAPGGHEGLQGDRGDQQGPGAPIFSVADYGPGGGSVHRRARTGQQALTRCAPQPVRRPTRPTGFFF